MSDHLTDIGHRLETVRQLGAVVNAMRGIAGARAQQARVLLPAIRAYAETAARAIRQAEALIDEGAAPRSGTAERPMLILFGAGQGFAGAFPELVLDAVRDDIPSSRMLLIGERSASLARERGLAPDWQTSLPSRAAMLATLATDIVEALYACLAEAGPARVTMVYPVWTASHGAHVAQRVLLPLDTRASLGDASTLPPIVNLPPAELLERLAQEYVFAQLCEAAAEAFAAENSARMETMAAARSHIDGKLGALEQEERLIRQEEITAEVVELAASTGFRRQRGGGKEALSRR